MHHYLLCSGSIFNIEIAKNTKLDEINKIAEKLEIKEEDIEQYGKYKAKISNEIYEKNKSKNNGKLILVTAISPTPLGEGKTTVSIAIADGLRKIGKKSILTLREPSLGPVFGIKEEQLEEEKYKLLQWKI